MAEPFSPSIRLGDLIEFVNGKHLEGETLARLSDAMLLSERLGDVADRLIGHFVDQARHSGATWSAIGEAMGVTKQAAQKRFAADVPGIGRGLVSLDRFTPRARNVVAAACHEARGMGRTQIGAEHLLLGLLREPDGVAAMALVALGTTPGEIRAAVGAPNPPPIGPAAEPCTLTLNDRAKVALGRGFHSALELGHSYIGTEHILLGLLADTSGPGARTLGSLGVDEPRAREWVEAKLDEMMAARTDDRAP